MANQNVRIPKFFPDIINHLMATGTAQNDNFDLISGTDLITTLNAGSEAELFDMNWLNQVHFETSASATTRADHILLNIDTGGDYTIDFVAILNHNFGSADAKIRVCHSDTESNVNNVVKMEDGSATAISGVTEVVNVNNSSSSNNIIVPSNNGSTVFTFTASDDRYWGIQIEGDSTFDSTYDAKMACVLIGESYSLPFAPNLSLKRTIKYDGVSVQESLGGQRYATSTQLGKQYLASTNKSPFTTATSQAKIYNGRLGYEFTMSYLNANQVMPEYYSTVIADNTEDTVVSDLYNRVLGNRIPFIFTQDSTSQSESDYMMARFVDNNFTMTQTATDIYDITMRLEEEF